MTCEEVRTRGLKGLDGLEVVGGYLFNTIATAKAVAIVVGTIGLLTGGFLVVFNVWRLATIWAANMPGIKLFYWVVFISCFVVIWMEYNLHWSKCDRI
ncbi:hypothetical protein BJP34_28860 [Moorena producens PAL-8-15-08-1]|uniref:Uncharacterized protein n=1 Tax=Moorena producens PAL-8-15-08-1 TaxID=1458985 RepID=A0A1D8TZ56_9CYAN|nr:hypothetical protein [Moorena producens]AOX02918.1 hypothetical protein BJP34_28860 [Moorena producens PAL-8-15-08-1]